jgi:hypothetical protein
VAALASAPAQLPATIAPTAAPSTSGAPAETPALPTAAPAGPDLTFEDHFDANGLKRGWDWINEPGGKWEIAGGRLTVGVLPQTRVVAERGVVYRLAAPALARIVPDNIPADAHYSAQVDLVVAPRQSFQEAGLIILSDRRQPLFTLARAFCDQPQPTCSGDALYLDDWRAFNQNAEGYHARQAAGGSLPADGPVALRLVVEPGRIRGEYSLDGGQHWEPVGEWPLARDARIGFVGLVTASGGQDAPAIPAHFDNFVMMFLPVP